MFRTKTLFVPPYMVFPCRPPYIGRRRRLEVIRLKIGPVKRVSPTQMRKSVNETVHVGVAHVEVAVITQSVFLGLDIIIRIVLRLVGMFHVRYVASLMVDLVS